MGRNPCCSKEGLNRGAWTASEDKMLSDYIKLHGEGKWRNLPKKAGLKRCGKSCRLRWLNYLRPDIKRGNISPDEEELIIRLHNLLGNRWSLIAGRLPGRTDNEIKNYWNTTLGKRAKNDRHQILFPYTINHHRSSNQDDRQPPNLKNREKVVAPGTASQSSSKRDDVQSTQVIRTKAFKCAKVLINPSQPFNFYHDNILTGPPLMDDNNNNAPGDDKSVEEEEEEGNNDNNNNMMFGCGQPSMDDNNNTNSQKKDNNNTAPGGNRSMEECNDDNDKNNNNSAAVDDRSMEEEYYNIFGCGANDYMMEDFNFGELCLSDLLNSEFV